MTQKSHKAVIEINNFPSDLVAWLHSLEFIQVKSNDSYRVHKTQFSNKVIKVFKEVNLRPLKNTDIVIASAAKQSDAKHRPE